MKRLLLVLLLALPTLLLADPVSLSCTLPTHNTDGSELTDLKGIRFYEGTVSGGPYFLIKENDPPVCAHLFERTAGIYYYVATAFNSADPEEESAYSGEAMKVIVDSGTIPNPPTDLVVDPDNLSAYTYAQSGQVISTYQVGWVAVGSACDETMSVNGYYRVEKEDVEFAAGADANILFAACGSGT